MTEPAEIIDAETGEITRAPAPLAVVGRSQSLSETRMAVAGVRQLSQMSELDFQERIKSMKLGKERMREVQRSLLDEGTDYGVIPGTKKKTLFKSGAEKLAEFYNFATSYEVTRAIGDGVTTPTIHYTVKCFVHLGSVDGPIIHAGVGTANSWETKYRYRGGSRKCPECGKEAIIKGKEEYGGGWLCFMKKDGCGAKWKDGAPEIEKQEVGKVENPDPYDQDNTFAKMGKKRSYVDGIIGALAISELFTQDIGDTGAEDHGGAPHGEPPQNLDERGTAPAPRGAPAAATKPPPGPSSGDKRADAMLDAFKNSTTIVGLEKLGAVIAKWPDDLKAIVKASYNKRHAELAGSEAPAIDSNSH
jgi:hypothetical protein